MSGIFIDVHLRDVETGQRTVFTGYEEEFTGTDEEISDLVRLECDEGFYKDVEKIVDRQTGRVIFESDNYNDDVVARILDAAQHIATPTPLTGDELMEYLRKISGRDDDRRALGVEDFDTELLEALRKPLPADYPDLEHLVTGDDDE